MKLKCKLDDGAKVPVRAYPADAGLDLFSRQIHVIRPKQWRNFKTGVHVEIPAGYYGKLESKSGLMSKSGIICPGGIIDSGYSGEISVTLYNLSDQPYRISIGDKVCQLLILPCELPEVDVVEEIDSGERGDAGFGSTGK